MPLTFGVEKPSRSSEYEGVTAVAAPALAALRIGGLAIASLKDRPHVMVTDKPARFPRTARLLRHADFERVYKEGRRHFSATMTVFYLARREGEGLTSGGRRAGVPSTGAQGRSAPHGLRVGFTVGRALGGAVQRNRMKRRLREAVRMTRPVTRVAADVVINPKKSLLTADFENVMKEVGRAFDVIEQKLSQRPAGGKF